MKFGSTCSECPNPIGKASKSGRCKPCAMRLLHSDPAYTERRNKATAEANRLPEARAKRKATMKDRYKDPAARQKMSDACRAAFNADPAKAEARRAIASNSLRRFHAAGDFDWSTWHRQRRAQAFAWLPAELVEDYRTLRIKVGAKEARRMMEAQIAATERARINAMSPFERDMERLRNGAGLVAAPDFRTPDPAFTLGGISSASL